jgi:hypothetical protein
MLEIPCKIVQFSRIFLKMQGYIWIIWVKLAGALWIIGGKLGSSLIFYFLAIDDWRSTTNVSRNLYTRLGTGAPASKYDIKQNCFI